MRSITLIVVREITTHGVDRNQMSSMAKQVREVKQP
jgi:hypothetical protein